MTLEHQEVAMSQDSFKVGNFVSAYQYVVNTTYILFSCSVQQTPLNDYHCGTFL